MKKFSAAEKINFLLIEDKENLRRLLHQVGVKCGYLNLLIYLIQQTQQYRTNNIYKTYSQTLKDFSITIDQIKYARKMLQKIGFIVATRERLHGICHYTVKFEEIWAALKTFVDVKNLSERMTAKNWFTLWAKEYPKDQISEAHVLPVFIGKIKTLEQFEILMTKTKQYKQSLKDANTPFCYSKNAKDFLAELTFNLVENTQQNSLFVIGENAQTHVYKRKYKHLSPLTPHAGVETSGQALSGGDLKIDEMDKLVERYVAAYPKPVEDHKKQYIKQAFEAKGMTEALLNVALESVEIYSNSLITNRTKQEYVKSGENFIKIYAFNKSALEKLISPRKTKRTTTRKGQPTMDNTATQEIGGVSFALRPADWKQRLIALCYKGLLKDENGATLTLKSGAVQELVKTSYWKGTPTYIQRAILDYEPQQQTNQQQQTNPINFNWQDFTKKTWPNNQDALDLVNRYGSRQIWDLPSTWRGFILSDAVSSGAITREQARALKCKQQTLVAK